MAEEGSRCLETLCHLRANVGISSAILVLQLICFSLFIIIIMKKNQASVFPVIIFIFLFLFIFLIRILPFATCWICISLVLFYILYFLRFSHRSVRPTVCLSV